MENRLSGTINVNKIIVTAPLDILLQRDIKRTERLNRNKQRAFWCPHFVVESFNKSLTWPVDFAVDSSVHTVEESSEMILEFCFKKPIILQ